MRVSGSAPARRGLAPPADRLAAVSGSVTSHTTLYAAAAGRHHDRPAGGHLPEGSAFAGSEARFALAGEDFPAGSAGFRLDDVVEVDEGQTYPRRQGPADRRLAGSGHAYQGDSALRAHYWFHAASYTLGSAWSTNPYYA
jgi:hypothetical protein